MMSEIKATNWPVPTQCRRCHADVLVCPVLDGDYVVPLIVDAWVEGQQWDEKTPGNFWERTVAHKPHECDEDKVAAIRAASERSESDE